MEMDVLTQNPRTFASISRDVLATSDRTTRLSENSCYVRYPGAETKLPAPRGHSATCAVPRGNVVYPPRYSGHTFKLGLGMESHTTPGGRNDSAGTTRDLRAVVRYALEARVVFTWTDDQGMQQKGLGWTRDISPKGVYVLALDCPPCRAQVTMSIYLPVPAQPSRVLSLEAEGPVLRVDPARDGGCCGFSVGHERVKLCAS